MKRNAVGYQRTLRKAWKTKLRSHSKELSGSPFERCQTHTVGQLFWGWQQNAFGSSTTRGVRAAQDSVQKVTQEQDVMVSGAY